MVAIVSPGSQVQGEQGSGELRRIDVGKELRLFFHFFYDDVLARLIAVGFARVGSSAPS